MRHAPSTARSASARRERKRSGECSRTTYSRPAARIRRRVATSSSRSETVSASSSAVEAGEDATAARVAHELLGAARRGRHDGHAAGERLGRDDPEPLLPGGEDEERRLAQGLGDRVDQAERVDALGHARRRSSDQPQPRLRERARGSAAAPRAGAAGSCAGRRRGRRTRASGPRAGRASSRPARARERRRRPGSAGSRPRPRHAPPAAAIAARDAGLIA